METQIYGLSLRFMITAVQWTKESSFRLRKTELDGSGLSETRTSNELASYKMYIFLNF